MEVRKICPFVLSDSFPPSNSLIWPRLSHTNWLSLSSMNKLFWFSLSWMKRLYRKLFLNLGVWNCTQLVVTLSTCIELSWQSNTLQKSNLPIFLYFQFSFFTFLLFLDYQTDLHFYFLNFLLTFLKFLGNQSFNTTLTQIHHHQT